MIMVTLTKLLTMRIVAKVRSESSLSISIHLSLSLVSGSISAKSFGVRLKNAISEPLANPDSIRRNTVAIKQKYTPIDGVISVISFSVCLIMSISIVL